MFIGKRADGSVYGAWTSKQPDDADHPNVTEVADDHPDLVAFVAAQAAKIAPKQETVADLKAELIAKGVITETEIAAAKVP